MYTLLLTSFRPRSFGRRERAGWWTLLALAGVVGLLAAAPAARAQTPEDALRFTQRFPGTGPRLMAMGGVNFAGLDDYGALLGNPAGLAYYQKSEIAGGLNTLMAQDEALFLTPGFSSALESDVSTTTLGNLAYIYSFPTAQGALVFGAAYNEVVVFDRDLYFQGENEANSISQSYLPYDDEWGFNADGDLEITGDIPFIAFQAGAIDFRQARYDDGQYPFIPAAAVGTTIEQTGNVTEGGRMSEANFGGAVEAAQGVMVGLSVNVPFGTYRFERVFDEDDFRGENTGSMYEIVLDDNEVLSGFDALQVIDNFESDLVGVNVRGGLSAELIPAIRVGLSVESPTFYSVDENYGSVVTTFFDQGGSLTYGDLPDDAGRGNFEYRIRTPWRFGAGVAFNTPQLLLSADAEYVDWSQLELDASADALYFDDLNRDIRSRFDGVINTRVGGEFRLGGLALRGGLAYQPDPVDSDIRLSDGSQLDRSRLYYSAGVGFRFAEQIQVDLGWMQERYDDIYSPYSDIETTPPVVEENVVRNRFSVGLRFLF